MGFFIGSHKVVELLQTGRWIIVIDNLSASKGRGLERIQEFTGKMPVLYQEVWRVRGRLNTYFRNHPDISDVVHFAGLKSVGESTQIPLIY